MMKSKKFSEMTYPQLSWQGFSSGVFLTYGYALLIFLYLAIRLVASVMGVEEPPHLFKTLMLMVMSLLLTILMFAALMSLVAGFCGALTAVLALWLARWFPYRKALAGVIVVLIVAMHTVIFAMSGTAFLTTHLSTYLFWVGIPTLIYLGFGLYAGKRLHEIYALAG